MAPGVSNWGNNDADTWLSFYRIDGLVFTGSGYIDGSGSSWWERSCKFSHKEVRTYIYIWKEKTLTKLVIEKIVSVRYLYKILA